MWRLIYAPLSWLGFIVLVNLPLIILGWVLIAIAALCKAYTQTPDGLYHFTWKFMWLYDNTDDGIACNDYSGYTNMFMRIVSWSAIRNPVSNLSHVPIIMCFIDPSRLRFVGSLGNTGASTSAVMAYDTNIPQWFFAWQGFYTCFYARFRMPFTQNLYLFWIGWKMLPTDIYHIPNYRSDGSGAGIQLNNYGPIGTNQEL